MSAMDDYVVTPKAVFEPETVLFYASCLEEAKALAAAKHAETGRDWRIYKRVKA